MCDYDTSPLYRQKIINRFKEIWGEDKTLQVATFGTLKPKAAIKRACKGLEIEDEAAEAMAMLVPVERGEARPLSICLDIQAQGHVTELINEVAKYKGLKEILLRLEGVIVSMGSHAGGVCFYNEPFINELAACRSPSGALQTCFDLHDAEATGTTKFDTLTTTATELIRKELELLVRDGLVEWKDNLRDTYESVIGINNLIYDDEEMWKMAPKVPQLFQFETPIGKQIMKKMNPKSIEELCAASSLMRLLPKSMKFFSYEQDKTPAGRYIRYREDVENFHRDAKKYGLNDKEISIVESVCKSDGYMTLHQETLMLLSMHPEVAGFTYAEANKLRKSVAGKNAEAQEEMKEKFYEWCKNQGTREIFAKYVWEQLFSAQLGYAFSVPHVLAYGLVALQELNLFYRFPEEYWYAAILDTEGISSEESSGAGVDYSKITKAIYGLQESGINVDPPLINAADNEFGIDVKNHKILFALSAIPLINDDDVNVIKEQRPYKNLKDFVNRSNFTKSKIINLIKAGAFGDAKKRMKLYAKLLVCQGLPTKFGTTQAKKYPDALPEKLASTMCMYTLLKDKGNFVGTKGSKKVYRLNESYKMLCADLKYDQDWWEDGDAICITGNGIDKSLKTELDEIKEYVKTTEFQNKYIECAAKELYKELIKNNEDTIIWQFDATSYYHKNNIFTDKMMKRNGWVRFEDMPEEPEYEMMTNAKGYEWMKFDIYSMPITVTGKNDIRKTIQGLTQDNKVVNIKMQDGQYAYYKAKKDGDASWFNRGELLVLHGYRRQDEFRLKIYKNGPYEHTIYRIKSITDKEVELQLTR